jgi:hypothetical protein
VTLKVINESFSVCKLKDYSQIDLNHPFTFTGATDEEYSLVCPTATVPSDTTKRSDGWRAFRIEGVLDFSLIGILSKISAVLAENRIGIFAISTFNTDYILTKAADFGKALELLSAEGYTIKHQV